MLLKTHLAFAVLMIIIFLEHVNHKFTFALLVLIATVIPDLDSGFSRWGRHLIFRPLQFFTKHRGIIHSFTTGVLISIILAVFWPIASLGFFIGFSVHLICDSFTIEGIKPFWPLKVKSSGFVRSGGRVEESLFFILIFVNIILFFVIFVL
jgi:inner membrane protein|tara:strand:- start:2529 stop:2981 length:453 start_codon:yes stop_codon:yes gene_type:complete